MPVPFAPFGESVCVGVVGGGVEHPRVGSVSGDAVALQIGDMFRERRRAQPPPCRRTIRTMTTTRLLGERDESDSAARRPRPKIERPGTRRFP